MSVDIKAKVYALAIRVLARLGVISHRTRVSWESIPTQSVNHAQLEMLGQGTSNILRVHWDGEPFYFRFCREHVARYPYLLETIDNYYYFSKAPESDRELVLTSIRKRHNRKRLLHLGEFHRLDSRIHRFFNSKDLSIVGIEAPYDRASEEYDALCVRLGLLLKYISNELATYDLNLNCGRYQTYNFNRSKAERIVAEEMGFPEMVCDSELVRLRVDDSREFIGSWMGKAPGRSITEITTETLLASLTPDIQKSLLTLHALDVICLEKDHRPENYNIVYDASGNARSVCAFDNDSPMAFFPKGGICFDSYLESSSFVDKDGMINRPFFSDSVAERIVSIQGATLKERLSPYLNCWQLRACVKRLGRLKAAISRTRKQYPERFLSDGDWSSKTVEAEVSDNKRRSYLFLLRYAHYKSNQYKETHYIPGHFFYDE